MRRKLVFGGNLALDEFADLVIGLAQVLGDLADQFLSIWMICSSVSVILPLACARAAMYCARSPASRAASRSSTVSRENCTSCWS